MLVGIYTSPESPLPMQRHESIEVLEQVGLAGDRYAIGKGFYTGSPEWDAPITLIQQEPFDALAEQGLTMDPGEMRRNLVTRSINLNWLIGREFQIGDKVVLRGRRAWPPCMHLIKLTGKGDMIKCFAHQCGIGADVVAGGIIRVGDPIFALRLVKE
ncbi:MAG: MOSC domain-containing protein [Gemmataceae bacterium]